MHRRDIAANVEEMVAQRLKLWGTGAMMKRVAPSAIGSLDAVAQFAKFERLSASPGAVRAFSTLNTQIDASSILPTVRVPTLVLHRQTDAQVPVERGRELASLIPNARLIEYPTGDHALFSGDIEPVLGDIEEFITGHRDSASHDVDRVLATVLFTDIVEFDAHGCGKG